MLARRPIIFDTNSDQVQLNVGDSSYIDIPDNSVDAIITDPPYFDNVMYSELSNFFYVWLREILKDRYKHFFTNLVPNKSEAIKNKVQGKDDKDFQNLLTSIFLEAGRKLKDQGLMVFTFHHKETKAWSSILKSVLDANFFISWNLSN
jgi:adenine-specific DNA methylase